VLAVVGCLAMFAAVTVYAAIAVGNAIVQFYGAGATRDGIAAVTVYAFKILDLFLVGTILYIVALGLAALFLDSEAALPRWFKVHELHDLKIILSQSVVVVMVVGFLSSGKTARTSSSSVPALRRSLARWLICYAATTAPRSSPAGDGP
jgi:uncharacterized membrane protein YqhA